MASETAPTNWQSAISGGTHAPHTEDTQFYPLAVARRADGGWLHEQHVVHQQFHRRSNRWSQRFGRHDQRGWTAHRWLAVRRRWRLLQHWWGCYRREHSPWRSWRSGRRPGGREHPNRWHHEKRRYHSNGWDHYYGRQHRRRRRHCRWWHDRWGRDNRHGWRDCHRRRHCRWWHDRWGRDNRHGWKDRHRRHHHRWRHCRWGRDNHHGRQHHHGRHLHRWRQHHRGRLYR